MFFFIIEWKLVIRSNFKYFLSVMAKKTLKQVKEEFKDYGFDSSVIEIAFANVDGNSDRIMDQIFRLQSESSVYPTKPSNPQDQDAMLSKAIELSMNQAKDKKISLQPLNPEQRLRKSGVPVGLKNIGNTCYFNSLLQTYFQNTQLVKAILNYQMPKKYFKVKDEDIQKYIQEDFQFKRKLMSCRLVEHLKAIFCSMIASDRKYLDPTLVLTSLVDNYGNQISIGDQKDIGEFNLIFLSRIEDGFQECRNQKKMEIQAKEPHVDIINSFGSEESLLRRSSIRIRDQSVIAQQFIGKIENVFINEKEGINKTEDQLFSLLMVNVKNRQLYKACEEITISHIDDYRNDKGVTIGVEKHSWIKQAPKTLFFQIDRVIYDKAAQNLKKVNDTFDFPTTFYIDPFLQKNKDRALLIQKTVKGLRRQKQKYINALQYIQKYGQKQFNLLQMLKQTESFLIAQNKQMEVQQELDNPIFIPSLASSIKPEFVDLISKYRENIGTRVSNYKAKIEEIDREIQKAYKEIYSTPYYLYSLLIHEGGADSGHYYSYTYDHHAQKWRKFNDINISEQVQEQVLRQGKGINVTSAYYLVYAQKQVLIPSQTYKLNYKLSNEEGYCQDYYSSFLKQEQKHAVMADNNHLYYQIEQHKMNSFATRVVDVYAKKFQTFNEIYRKSKIDKKKNTPPLLTSLPIFVKSNDEEQYKNVIIEQAIFEYGPKQQNVVFDELLKKKLSNFNDFKKPRKFSSSEKWIQNFISSYHCAIAARRLFESMQRDEYSSIFALLKFLLKTDNQDYFNWLSRILLKTFVVKFLDSAEKEIKTEPVLGIQKLKMIVIIINNFINKEQERMLLYNSVFWINQILVQNQHLKGQIEQIIEFLDGKKYQDQYKTLQLRNQQEIDEIVKSVDVNDALWNASRQQNTIVNTMLQGRERVKGKFQACNKLYMEMKKNNVPLNKSERDKFLKL